MTTFREALLAQEGPLDAHDVGILVDWLAVLREDVASFGATAEDEARMSAITDRIARERAAPPRPSP